MKSGANTGIGVWLIRSGLGPQHRHQGIIYPSWFIGSWLIGSWFNGSGWLGIGLGLWLRMIGIGVRVRVRVRVGVIAQDDNGCMLCHGHGYVEVQLPGSQS